MRNHFLRAQGFVPPLSWTSVDSGATGSWVFGSCSGDGTYATFANGDAYLYRTANSGGSWSVPTTGFVAIATATSSDGSIVYATTNSYAIYKSTNYGVDWSIIRAAGSEVPYTITCSADGQTVVVGCYVTGGILYSANGGTNWYASDAPAGYYVACDLSADGTKGIACDVLGYVYITTNSGVNWTQQTGLGSANWQGVAISDDGARCAAANSTTDGDIHISTNGGSSWASSLSVPSHSPMVISGSADGLRLVSLWTDSNLRRTTNGGSSWFVDNPPGLDSPAMLSMSRNTPFRVYALDNVAGDGAIFTGV